MVRVREAIRRGQKTVFIYTGVLAMKEHCMKEYTPFQQRMSCVNCGEPLNNNRLVNDAYALNTTAAWAREQLGILADMIDNRESITGKEKDWFAKEIRDKINRIKFLD